MLSLVYLLATMSALLAAAMLFPLGYAVVHDEATVVGWGIAGTVVGFVGIGVWLALRGPHRRLTRAQALGLVVCAWLILPVFACLPLIFGGVSRPLVAYVDAVSALTASGAVFGPPLSEWPRSLVLWISMLQWLGGGLALFFLVVILGPAGVGGLPTHQVRIVEHGGDTETERFAETLAEIGPLYAAATSACFVALMLSGIPAFDALCIALGTLSAGGLLPNGGAFSAYANPAAEIIVTLAMVYAAVSVLWLRVVTHARFRQAFAHRETRLLLAGISALGLAAAAALMAEGMSPTDALRRGFFIAASIVSTTGTPVVTEPPAYIPLAVVAAVAFVGGSAYSVAGGIKIHRAATTLVQAVRDLMRALYPNLAPHLRLAGQPMTTETSRAIWASFGVGAIMFAAMIIAVAPFSGSFAGAYMVAIGILSNTTQIAALVEGTPAFAEWPDPAKILVAAGLVLARVEALGALALLHLAVWRR